MVVSTALADPPKPDAKNVETAKRYVDAGIAAQQAGDYETAIAMYSKAYDLVPKPILIFNMAQATRLGGRQAQAIELYKRYLEAEPNGAQAATAKEFVSAYEAKQAADDQAKQAGDQAAADQAATLKAAEERGRREQEQADLARRQAEQQQPSQLQPTQTSARAPSEQPSSSLRIPCIATGVVGLAGIGLGIGFGVHARSLSNDLSQPGAVFDPGKFSSGQTANQVAIASYVAGGVLLATSVTLFALGHQHGHADVHGVAVAPAILQRRRQPRGGGLLALTPSSVSSSLMGVRPGALQPRRSTLRPSCARRSSA